MTGTGVFPGLASEMIAVGEQTGALPQMLNSVAEFFEEDVSTALTAALALIEPAILIIVGVGLETVKQIESQLMQRNYEGFLR